MGEHHPRIQAGVSEGDRSWATVDLTPATLPHGVTPKQLSVTFIAGDYHLEVQAFGPNNSRQREFFAWAKFRFRSTRNGGSSLRRGSPAAGRLLQCLTAAAESQASQSQPATIKPNLPWVSVMVDEGSGWLGLSTAPDGAWWLACLPFAADGDTRVSDSPSIMSHAKDASLLLRVPLDLPPQVYEGLKRLYDGLKRDAASPRHGGNFG